jgi:hypothetical protein
MATEVSVISCPCSLGPVVRQHIKAEAQVEQNQHVLWPRSREREREEKEGLGSYIPLKEWPND